MTMSRIPGLSWLWRAILPAGGVAALLLVLAMAASAPSVAAGQGPAQQAAVRDPERLAVLRPQNPVPFIRDVRAGDRRATPNYPVAPALRPTQLEAPVVPALRQAPEPDGQPKATPTKHVLARAPPAAA
jgi:hypothetical protein